jgi:hypothetical protein
LLVDPLLMAPPVVEVSDANGRVILTLAVPNDQSLMGASLFGQWLFVDAGGTPLPPLPGIAVSGGAELRLGLQ